MTSETQRPLPPRLREIIEDFQWSEAQEKLELLLQFSEQLPELPDWLRGNDRLLERVEECLTPVFLHAEARDGRIFFHIDVPRSAPTVRGFASLLLEGINGLTPEEVLEIPGDFYLQMGLEQALSHQRLNGIASLLAHMKRLALEKVS